RFGVLFTSYALRDRIWFDYALADRASFDDPRLIFRCGFYTAAGEIDPARAYTGDPAARVLESGGLWPACSPRSAVAARNPASPTLGRIDLTRTLPCEVKLDAPVAFNAHYLGAPLHLNGEPIPGWGVDDEEPIANGVSMTAPGLVRWKLPPAPGGSSGAATGAWRLTGRVGPDYAAKPPRIYPRALLGFRVLVDGQEVWTSAPPRPPLAHGARTPPGPPLVPPAWTHLSYPLDITLPPGAEVELEVVGLSRAANGNVPPPWELPPAVWGSVQLEWTATGAER
ncbi:MAG TPA: hypothetical protein VL860_06380, partial [Planctomycetota bacterium]|nr:hypothetical protein [Planctomycetota bacterium]